MKKIIIYLLILNIYGDYPGQLDISFGGNNTGYNANPVSSSSNPTPVGSGFQIDGKFIIAGYDNSNNIIISRYNSDGVLDLSFGNQSPTNGLFTGSGLLNSIGACTVQPDGKILIGGIDIANANNFAILRILGDGSGVDTLFGNNGIAIAPFLDGYSSINSIAIQSDNKIVAAGSTYLNNKFALARYNYDGTLDLSFGTNGVVDTPINSGAVIKSIVIDYNNNIFAVGSSYSSDFKFTIVKYNSNGQLDTTFNNANPIVGSINNSQASACTIEYITTKSNPQLLFAGSSNFGADFLLARYDTITGVLDTSFGVDGYIEQSFGAYGSQAYCVAIAPNINNNIIASGNDNELGNCEMVVASYNSIDGSVDIEFGQPPVPTSGYVLCPSSYPANILFQQDGKMVISSYYYDCNITYGFCIARFLMGVSNAPTAVSQNAFVAQDRSQIIILSVANPLQNVYQFNIVNPPANGTLSAITQTSANTATVIYTPNAQYVGIDSFTFSAQEMRALYQPTQATVSIVVLNDFATKLIEKYNSRV